MKFGFVRDDSGKERELTQSSFSSFLQQRDPKVRHDAFHRFYAEFKDHQFTLASSLGSSIRADVFDSRARNYSSAINAALFADDALSVYDNHRDRPQPSGSSLRVFRFAAACAWLARDPSLRHLCPHRRRHADECRLGRRSRPGARRSGSSGEGIPLHARSPGYATAAGPTATKNKGKRAVARLVTARIRVRHTS